jgi:hypothetical protein
MRFGIQFSFFILDTGIPANGRTELLSSISKSCRQSDALWLELPEAILVRIIRRVLAAGLSRRHASVFLLREIKKAARAAFCAQAC